MVLQVTAATALGLAAGVLILALGGFVLAARPTSGLHRFFFAFAAADGASTILFVVRDMATSDDLALYAMLGYGYAFIVFVFLLIALGLTFPAPVGGARGRIAVAIGCGATAFATLVAYTADYRTFWYAERAASGTDIVFRYNLLGTGILSLWIAATAIIMLRLLWHLKRNASPSHRQQGAFVLGGLALAYAPFATTSVIAGIRRGVAASFLSPALDLATFYWAAGAFVLALALAMAIVVLERREDRRFERGIILACLVGVVLLTAMDLAAPDGTMNAVATNLGLLAYPALVGYAILRFGVLDIEPRLHRAAMVSVAAVIAGVVFIVLEVAIENALQDRAGPVLGSDMAAGILAAVATSGLVIPLSRMVAGVGKRLKPSVRDDFTRRRLEIYTHGVFDAYADGYVDVEEARAIAILRKSLGITADEHSQVVRDVTRRLGITP